MDSEPLLGDRYRLLSRLGTGGMSVVWLARDEQLDQEVAVKIMTRAASTDPRLCERLRAEAQIASRIRHARVVDVLDWDETPEGYPYVVMEMVRGESLSTVLHDGAVAWPFAVRVAAELATALAAAHRQGIVHRDVAPGNVILAPDGVKLFDFGIAARVGEPDAGPDDTVVGTLNYLAPERLERTSVNPSADIYAFGVLLYRLLAGRPPWDAETVAEVLNAHCCEEPAPLPPIAGLPADVRELCHQCLAKEPTDRPDAATVAGVLSGFTPAGDDTVVIPRRLSFSTRTGPPSRTRSLAAAAVVLAVLVALATTIVHRAAGSEPSLALAPPFASAVGGNRVDCWIRDADRLYGSSCEPTGTEPPNPPTGGASNRNCVAGATQGHAAPRRAPNVRPGRPCRGSAMFEAQPRLPSNSGRSNRRMLGGHTLSSTVVSGQGHPAVRA
jgi:serine/threonine-protein kinase